MTECIIERPRHGGVRNYHSNRPRIKHLDIDDLDSLPKSEGYRRPHLDNGKELSDFLNPLYRFLLSNVGRKWNDVYSEIRQNINPNSTTQIHILDHVLTWVNVNTFIGEDGKVYIIGAIIFFFKPLLKWRRQMMRDNFGFAYRDEILKIRFRNLLTELFENRMQDRDFRRNVINRIDDIFDSVGPVVDKDLAEIAESERGTDDSRVIKRQREKVSRAYPRNG